MIEAGKMKEEEWSRYNGKGRGKKPDNGQLSINHPKINFLGDKGHRVRGYAKKCFALAALSLRRRILVARSWMPNGWNVKLHGRWGSQQWAHLTNLRLPSLLSWNITSTTMNTVEADVKPKEKLGMKRKE
jgi:hypothetical protein